MKMPEVVELDSAKPVDAFSAKVEQVAEKANQKKPKSYTLPERQISYINSLALELSQSRGKLVSASEALRIIIEQHSTARVNA